LHFCKNGNIITTPSSSASRQGMSNRKVINSLTRVLVQTASADRLIQQTCVNNKKQLVRQHLSVAITCITWKSHTDQPITLRTKCWHQHSATVQRLRLYQTPQSQLKNTISLLITKKIDSNFIQIDCSPPQGSGKIFADRWLRGEYYPDKAPNNLIHSYKLNSIFTGMISTTNKIRLIRPHIQ